MPQIISNCERYTKYTTWPSFDDIIEKGLTLYPIPTPDRLAKLKIAHLGQIDQIDHYLYHVVPHVPL